MVLNMVELSAKLVRSQLGIFKAFTNKCSLETARKGQDTLGSLVASVFKNEVSAEDIRIGDIPSSITRPLDETAGGIILYLHGGGYTCGDLDYAKGFAATLAAKCGIKVMSPAYRLAPEAPFPAAVEDALAAFDYLLCHGYTEKSILLAGESAGGGLCYVLCLKLRELGRELPAGIIAVSPWSDLTSSGESYTKNIDVDPSMTVERLRFYANCYVHGAPEGISDTGRDRVMKSRPMVSPLFGSMVGMPPSVIFVGGDEIMLDDSRMLHERLLTAGVRSRLVITPRMWHGYMLYCLKENEADFEAINTFIKSVLPVQRKLRWMRLDNAAKIYPAARTRNWSNLFRLSATLSEDVDRTMLSSALDVTIRRFPSMAVRIRRSMFWYYLEEIPKAPPLSEEHSCPLTRMPFDDIRKCAFRVIVYKSRISVEFFHAITDGNGALVFLKTLCAEYLNEKYNARIPATNGVLDRLEEPTEEELEDAFLKNSGSFGKSRSEQTAFTIKGTPESDGFKTLTTFILNPSEVNAVAGKYNATVTAFLCAAMISAIINIQNDAAISLRKRKPVKVLIPVNLRKLFGAGTLRNFVLYTTPGIDPRLGKYDFTEICNSIYHQMKLEITPKQMQRRITTNVKNEQSVFLKILPLFIKNAGMKLIFHLIGEKKSCLTLSNLGVVRVPERMKEYVKRMDFILGVQESAPYNCGIISYNDILSLSLIRNIKEPLLERALFEVLRELGISVTVESNLR